MPAVEREVKLGSGCVCRKCGAAEVAVVLRKTDPYCKACFTTYVTHKFRSCLGKHRAVEAGSAVLVAVRGGAACRAMLRMLHLAVTDSSNKRLRVRPSFLHVTTEEVEPSSAANSQRIVSEVEALGYTCHTVPLCCAVDDDLPITASTPPPSHAARRRLAALIEGAGAARDLLLASLVRAVTQRACAALRHAVLFTCHTATHTATQLLASIAAGAGASLVQQLSFREDLEGGIRSLKPLLEIDVEELRHLLRLQGVACSEPEYRKGTISGCTKAFIGGLQRDFPSTVPTVLRIAGKLLPYSPANASPALPKASTTLSDASPNPQTSCNGLNEDGESLNERVSGLSVADAEQAEFPKCGLCRHYLDTRQPEASALRAGEISLQLSRRAGAAQLEEIQRAKRVLATVPEGADAVTRFGSLVTFEDARPHLCYACRRVLQPMSDFSVLPPVLLRLACGSAERRLSLLL